MTNVLSEAEVAMNEKRETRDREAAGPTIGESVRAIVILSAACVVLVAFVAGMFA